MKNPNCDGSHCREETGEVRVYPIGGGGNIILCLTCWAHENKYRHERAASGKVDPANFPQQDWGKAEVYHNG